LPLDFSVVCCGGGSTAVVAVPLGVIFPCKFVVG